MFVDYAGDRVPLVVDRRTGEVRDAHLVVAVLGGSSLSFACATWTEQFADWIEAHNSASHSSAAWPDNAKVPVIKACHFDPVVNRSYTDMAATTARRCSRRGRESRGIRRKSSLRRHCRTLGSGPLLTGSSTA